MTSYTFSGFSELYAYDPATDRFPTTGIDTGLEIVVVAADNAGLIYDYFDPNQPDAFIVSLDAYSVKVNGVEIDPTGFDLVGAGFDWTGSFGTNSTLLFILDGYSSASQSGEAHFLVLDGDPLPGIQTPQDLSDFFGLQVTASFPLTGSLGPNTLIEWGNLPYDSITENDVIPGTDLGDTILAGAGDDVIESSGGNDTLNGGAGKKDQVSFANDPNGVTANLGTGKAKDGFGGTDVMTGVENLRGSALHDTLIGDSKPNDIQCDTGNDTIKGVDGNDMLSGGKGKDVVIGGAGRDTIKGGVGRDTLNGGSGNDTIDGGKGKDIINPGKGHDTITGGADADTIIFGKNFGTDRLTDFDANWNAEKIDLSDVRSIKTWNDLKKNHLSESGPDVIIDDLNGNTITLENVLLADLNARDFIF
ncbi:MAG: calcium-binding protein [Marinibacterium sp.]